MAQIGYDHKDSGETLYLKYPIKKYPLLISKITGQEVINKPLIIKLDHTKSPYSLKYGAKFQNIFYYRLNPSNNKDNSLLQLLNFNLYLSQKSKLIKLVNFDVSPIIKISMHNISSYFPFSLGFKCGTYQASRIQHFDSADYQYYDISKVLKSMLPYFRTGISIKHNKNFEFSFLNKKFDVMTRHIIALNRIHNYEDNLKISTGVKIYFDIFEEVKKLFLLRVCNEFTIKKAFISHYKNIKSKFANDDSGNISRKVKEHHVLSGYECHSKLLEMNLLNIENVIENGSDFYLQNQITLRLKEIPYLKDNEILTRVNPYFSFETIFLPFYKKIGNKDTNYEIDLKNSVRFIYTIGLSIALNEYMHINFGLYTGASDNAKIKKEHLNRFRITLSL
jgi:hypothetical protein